jgi:hypothetical protein
VAGVQQVEAPAGRDDGAAGGPDAGDELLGRLPDGAGRRGGRPTRPDAAPARGDERGWRPHGAGDGLGRQGAVGEQAGRGGGEAVTGTARVGARHVGRRDDRRRGVAADEQRAAADRVTVTPSAASAAPARGRGAWWR